MGGKAGGKGVVEEGVGGGAGGWGGWLLVVVYCNWCLIVISG